MEIKVYRNKTIGQLECWPYEINNEELEFLGTADDQNIRFQCSLEVDRENQLQDLIAIANKLELDPEFIKKLESDAELQEETIHLYEKTYANDDGWNYSAEFALDDVLKNYESRKHQI